MTLIRNKNNSQLLLKRDLEKGEAEFSVAVQLNNEEKQVLKENLAAVRSELVRLEGEMSDRDEQIKSVELEKSNLMVILSNKFLAKFQCNMNLL